MRSSIDHLIVLRIRSLVLPSLFGIAALVPWGYAFTTRPTCWDILIDA